MVYKRDHFGLTSCQSAFSGHSGMQAFGTSSVYVRCTQSSSGKLSTDTHTWNIDADLDLRALPPEEARLARITVYALNAIVMVFALPVGAALLALNVFRGEDLRATAHGLALTGAWLGFISTPQGALFVSSLI